MPKRLEMYATLFNGVKENTLHSIILQLIKSTSLFQAQKENNKLLAQIKAMAEEKVILVEHLNKSQAAQKDAQANCEK